MQCVMTFDQTKTLIHVRVCSWRLTLLPGPPPAEEAGSLTAVPLARAAANTRVAAGMAAMDPLSPDGSAMARKLRRLFTATDTDGGGTLSQTELGSLCADMGVELSALELQEAMFVMDADGSGEVDFDEFAAWFTGEGAVSVPKIKQAVHEFYARQERLRVSEQEAEIARLMRELGGGGGWGVGVGGDDGAAGGAHGVRAAPASTVGAGGAGAARPPARQVVGDVAALRAALGAVGEEAAEVLVLEPAVAGAPFELGRERLTIRRAVRLVGPRGGGRVTLVGGGGGEGEGRRCAGEVVEVAVRAVGGIHAKQLQPHGATEVSLEGIDIVPGA